jgi:hypothetical protein
MTTYIGTATNDTFIDDGAPTSNYGTFVYWLVGHYTTDSRKRRSLIKFDISSIPAGAVISGGTLAVTFQADNAGVGGTICAYRQLKNWVSGTATWNKYDASNNWTTAGGFDAADCEQSESGSATFTASETLNTVKNIPISTSKISEWVSSGTANYGFLLKTTVENNNLYQYHSTEATTAGYRPTLTITYTEPSSSGYTLILNT